MSDLDPQTCHACIGKGYNSYNINFGSGPAFYSPSECSACKGTGVYPASGEKKDLRAALEQDGEA